MRLLTNKLQIFLTVFILSTPVFAEIVETPLCHPIQLAVEKADQETLFIFDIDDVLIVPKDQILCPPYRQKLKEALEAYPKTQAEKLSSFIWLQHQACLVEATFVQLIQKLKEKKVKTIALTRSWTGKVGVIPSFEDLRLEILKSFGSDFSWAFPDTPPLVFEAPTTKEPTKELLLLNKEYFLHTCYQKAVC